MWLFSASSRWYYEYYIHPSAWHQNYGLVQFVESHDAKIIMSSIHVETHDTKRITRFDIYRVEWYKKHHILQKASTCSIQVETHGTKSIMRPDTYRSWTLQCHARRKSSWRRPEAGRLWSSGNLGCKAAAGAHAHACLSPASNGALVKCFPQNEISTFRTILSVYLRYILNDAFCIFRSDMCRNVLYVLYHGTCLERVDTFCIMRLDIYMIIFVLSDSICIETHYSFCIMCFYMQYSPPVIEYRPWTGNKWYNSICENISFYIIHLKVATCTRYIYEGPIFFEIWKQPVRKVKWISFVLWKHLLYQEF